jgi:hypothetical protein
MIVKAYDIRYINQNIEDDRQLRIYYKIKMKEATESNWLYRLPTLKFLYNVLNFFLLLILLIIFIQD